MNAIDNQIIRLIADYVNLIKGSNTLRNQESKNFANQLLADKEKQLVKVGLNYEQISLLRKAVRL